MAATRSTLQKDYIFSLGARGFLIQQIQRAVGLSPDGIFGRRTADALRAIQQRNRLPVNGTADAQTCKALGLQWPDDFQRCMNLTSVVEGTSFGDCNATDIDGAGLTMGIAGFTTAHGEVQEIISAYLAANPRALDVLDQPLKQLLQSLLRRGPAGTEEWRQLFYGSSIAVRPQWRTILHTWGNTPEMQDIQLNYAREHYWMNALEASEKLGVTRTRGHALLFDIAVQNGGWAARHQRVYDALCASVTISDENHVLELIAHSVADCASPRWRKDVLTRKLLFAHGAATVHGIRIDLNAYAV